MLGCVLRHIPGLLGGLIALLTVTADARAERRVALVIGNAHYQHASTLRNPLNDAQDISALLKTLGFEVLLGTDLDERAFASQVDQFGRMLEGADVGLFFYAGHGLQMNEKNYLVSTQARLDNEFLIPAETVEVDAIVRLMESRSRINLVFLDACRNNPLTDKLRQNLAAAKRSVSLGRGLARVEAGRDTLIAFAAAPGQEAADGRERNSPFTAALLQHLPKPGVEVSVMLKEVAAQVRKATNNMQRPQQLSDMSQTFYFAKPDPLVAASTSQSKIAQLAADNAIEVAHWNSARAANDCESVRAYLERFPNGNFADLARLSERRLCDQSRRLPSIVRQTSRPTPAPSTVERPRISTPSVNALTSPRLVVTAVPESATSPAQPKTAALPEPAAPVIEPAETDVAPQPSAVTPEPVGGANSDKVDADLARELQRELVRVGCATVRPDGVWGSRSRDALEEFSRHTRTEFDPDTPSRDALAAVQRHKGRVCSVEAPRPHIKREPPQPHETVQPRSRSKSVERAPVPVGREWRSKPAERTYSPVVHERPSTPEPRGRVAATRDWKSINALCQSAYMLAGRMCCTYDPPSGAPRIICP